MSKITMRAKMQVSKVERFNGSDRITCNAVAAKSYPEDGSDEDNTYAKFSPSGELSLTIANPALLGVIEAGQKFYLDFTPAE
ncbi:hypothetical protein JQ574_22675 [Bradyrhizobium sp. AUGA SZCCT0158]|uniref:hypothetical protein n=1 Tax=Bradyrhizobium sp. AUGA SZCCT0158 TaxID=2807661 RepID=UPI001BAE5152|nr:hypothetical protein [Bradyrhizobium sp. AUGA SZCCT0158]MBR1198805.1 hypothetical protein [Bradyrhizobium sp. AUGA SZCCT0158]